MEETLMTTEAATTPEGQDASQPESTTETPTNEVAVESQAETSEQASLRRSTAKSIAVILLTPQIVLIGHFRLWSGVSTTVKNAIKSKA